MSKTKNPFKRPTFMFEFDDELSAHRFYNCAMSSQANLVQHPFEKELNCKQNFKKVLVTGLGSIVFDTILCDMLCEEAKKLGGHYIPRVC